MKFICTSGFSFFNKWTKNQLIFPTENEENILEWMRRASTSNERMNEQWLLIFFDFYFSAFRRMRTRTKFVSFSSNACCDCSNVTLFVNATVLIRFLSTMNTRKGKRKKLERKMLWTIERDYSQISLRFNYLGESRRDSMIAISKTVNNIIQLNKDISLDLKNVSLRFIAFDEFHFKKSQFNSLTCSPHSFLFSLEHLCMWSLTLSWNIYER